MPAPKKKPTSSDNSTEDATTPTVEGVAGVPVVTFNFMGTSFEIPKNLYDWPTDAVLELDRPDRRIHAARSALGPRQVLAVDNLLPTLRQFASQFMPVFVEAMSECVWEL